MEEDVIISFRVPKRLRNQFQIAMKESNTNASEYLRDAMKKRVRGMMPAPEMLDPVDFARKILEGHPVWRMNNCFSGKTDDEYLAEYFNILAYTIVEQSILLDEVVILGEKISSERENIVAKFLETKPDRKPYEPPSPPVRIFTNYDV